MIKISLKWLVALVGACSLFFLSGCGGNGSDQNGYAPQTLEGYMLQITTEGGTGVTPGVVNITSATASMGIIHNGTEYEAQVIYTKVAPNEASVAFSYYLPDIGTPTTRVYTFAAYVVFNADSKTGTVTSWTYRQTQAGEEPSEANGSGNSGYALLVNL